MKLFSVCFTLLVCGVTADINDDAKYTTCDKLNAYQSTTGVWGGIEAGAWRAIDDNTNTQWYEGGCTHTARKDADPYLTIDLGCVKTIKQVEIANRADGHSFRLNNFELVITTQPYSLLTRSSGSVCAFYKGNFPAGKKSVKCAGKGRFVTIRYKNPEKQPVRQRFIHVCNVKVITA